MKMYLRADRTYRLLEKQIKKLFARHRNIASFDELNVIADSHKLYAELEDQALKAFLELARQRFADIVGVNPDEIDMAWLLALLAGYDAVTKYVFTHEVERKRARLAEAVIASTAVMPELLRARNLWLRQIRQYTLNVEDAAVEAAYAKIGVKKVEWVTQMDGKECPICHERNGKIYALRAVPKKPHYNCRCYILPVESDL